MRWNDRYDHLPAHKVHRELGRWTSVGFAIDALLHLLDFGSVVFVVRLSCACVCVPQSDSSRSRKNEVRESCNCCMSLQVFGKVLKARRWKSVVDVSTSRYAVRRCEVHKSRVVKPLEVVRNRCASSPRCAFIVLQLLQSFLSSRGSRGFAANLFALLTK